MKMRLMRICCAATDSTGRDPPLRQFGQVSGAQAPRSAHGDSGQFEMKRGWALYIVQQGRHSRPRPKMSSWYTNRNVTADLDRAGNRTATASRGNGAIRRTGQSAGPERHYLAAATARKRATVTDPAIAG